jgi:hypothetical protein
MQGLFHSYYALVLAPPIAGLVAVGGAAVWQRRSDRRGRGVLALAVAGTAAWCWVVLQRTPAFAPGLAAVVLVAGLAAALLLLRPTGLRGRLGATVAAAALLAALGGPVAFAADSVASPHSGASTSAGPRLPPPGVEAVAGGRGPGVNGPGPRGPEGPPGGTHGGSAPNRALVALLTHARTRWSAATPGSAAAAALELATGTPVMAIGGYSGTDPVPSLAGFRADVAAGRVHYFIAEPGRPRGGSAGAPALINAWVGARYRPSVVGGARVYDLLPARTNVPRA